ncbi:hypothetical protein INT47_009020 [Mucor saturninus]|uniref:Uncharacterized protein n=1 Tax=Mucor saturninus TaxID=64648 RepID=A0A8H7V041_9FUNG|nr:hypothetical protein INT47_009020 [Mucor saturninus]
MYDLSIRMELSYQLQQREAACIAHNKERTKVLSWGSKARESQRLESNSSDIVYMDNFMNELYRVYPKYKVDKNDRDVLNVLQSVTDYILHLVNDIKTEHFVTEEHENANVFKFHYVFIVPTEWEYSIREDMLRPMFITSGLISETDHPNRLLFFTKLQSILQLIQHPKFQISNRIKKSTQYLMCGIVQAEDSLRLNLDAFEFKDSVADSSTHSTLDSRVSKSEILIIDNEQVTRNLNVLLEGKGFLVDEAAVLQETIQLLLRHFPITKIIKQQPEKEDIEEFPFKKINGIESLRLNNMQLKLVKSITTTEFYEAAFAPIVTNIENSIRSVFSNDFRKIRSLIILKEVIFKRRVVAPSLFEWVIIFLEKIGEQFNYKVLPIKDDRLFLKLRPTNVIEGAGRKLLEKIKIADSILAPKLIRRNTLNDEMSLAAIFSDIYPSTIVTINISLETNLLSCIHIGEKTYVTINNNCSLQPLKNFFIKSDPPTLRVLESTVVFLDKNFGDALNYFSQYDRQFVKEEAALSVKTSTTKNRIDHPNKNSLIKYISEYIKTRPCKEKTGKPRDFFSVKKNKLMAEIQLHLNQNPTQYENAT